MSKIVQFQAIQFGISTQFSSIWPMDRIRSGSITSGQSGSEIEDNKDVLRIPQSFIFTEA